MYYNPYSKQFEEDEDDDKKTSVADGEVEYSFEGYRIEFNEKIMLTPVSTKTK
jgi:hypothetical protein